MAIYKKTGKILGINLEEVKKRLKYSVAAPNGSLICHMWFMEIKPYVEGLAVVKHKKNIFSKMQCGVVDIYGIVTLFSGEYNNAIVLGRNLIAVQEKVREDQKGRWGLVDKNGTIICKPKYSKCPEWLIKDKLLLAQIDELLTLLDNKGHQLCKAQYTRVRTTCRRETESGIACEGSREGYWYKINFKGVELKTRYHERAWDKVPLSKWNY